MAAIDRTTRRAEDRSWTGGPEACPACARNSLTARGALEICAACGWQDDPRARTHPDRISRANGESLEEARANVERFGIAFPPSEAGV